MQATISHEEKDSEDEVRVETVSLIVFLQYTKPAVLYRGSYYWTKANAIVKVAITSQSTIMKDEEFQVALCINGNKVIRHMK